MKNPTKFTKNWAALFASNFLGVFNDNLLKNAIIFISIGWHLPYWMNHSQLIALVSASLVLPYLLLSPLAGRLAVKHSKLKIFRFFKLIEFPIMILAVLSFYFQWVVLALISVLLMGIQSSLYSPAKYSLIRDIGGEKGASFGSGMFETMAFMGILIGTLTASVIADHYSPLLISIFFLVLAILGYWTTRAIKANELPAEKDHKVHLNPIRFLAHSYHEAKKHSFVNIAVFGASSFWLIGGMLQMNLVVHSKIVYGLSNTYTGIIMSGAAIGIALGTWAAGFLSKHKIQKGFVLPGLITMTIFMGLLTFLYLPVWLYAFSVFAFAFSGGFFQVPLLAILQTSNVGRKLGDVIAYLNLVTFIFVLFGTALFSLSMWLTNENSYLTYGIILVICLLTTLIFATKNKAFRNEMLVLYKKQTINKID